MNFIVFHTSDDTKHIFFLALIYGYSLSLAEFEIVCTKDFLLQFDF